MFKLFSGEPFWLTLIEAADKAPAARGLFAPVDNEARSAALDAAAAVKTDGGSARQGGDAFTAELIRRCLLDWEGIGDAKGKPVPCTAETRELAIRDPRLFAAIDAKFVMPALAEEQEKNASGRSPGGNSAGATPAKPTAPRARAAVKTAPSKSTASKPRKAGASGRS